MKEINIGKIIYQKRKERNMTQEDLATHLNITKAAVSKWETNQSYPDISLLPTLASLFNISIDNLVGYQPQMHKSDIKKLYHQLANDFSSKPFIEVYANCQQIINKYYSCFELLLQMAVLLMNHASLANSPIKIYEYVNELTQRIINECDDVNISQQSKHLQSIVLSILKRPLDIIELFPEIKQPLMLNDIMVANAYVMLNDHDKANEILQIYQYQYIFALLQNSLNYIDFNNHDLPRVKETTKRMLELIDIYQLDEIHPSVILSVYARLAMFSANQGDDDQALEYLQKYVEITTTLDFPLVLKGDQYFDKLDSWFEHLDLGPLAPRSDTAIIKSIQEVILNPVFASLNNKVEYRQLVNRLNQYLGGNKHEF